MAEIYADALSRRNLRSARKSEMGAYPSADRQGGLGNVGAAAKNPRPTTFLEIAEWEKKRTLIIEHEIMEQIVLQIRG